MVFTFLAIVLAEIVFFVLVKKFGFNFFVTFTCSMFVISLCVLLITMAILSPINANITAESQTNDFTVVEYKVVSSIERIEENKIGRHASYDTEYIIFELEDGEELKVLKKNLKDFDSGSSTLVCKKHTLNNWQKFWYMSKTFDVYYTANT